MDEDSRKVIDKAQEKAPIIVVFLSLLILCFGVLYAYQDRSTSPSVQKRKGPARELIDGMVRFKVVFGLGEKDSIGIKVAFPCNDNYQRHRLIAAVPRLKDDILTNTDPAKMEKWVQSRDFRAIRGHLLDILNRYEKAPIKQLYFEDFSYE